MPQTSTTVGSAGAVGGATAAAAGVEGTTAGGAISDGITAAGAGRQVEAAVDGLVVAPPDVERREPLGYSYAPSLEVATREPQDRFAAGDRRIHVAGHEHGQTVAHLADQREGRHAGHRRGPDF